jgi:hypothetical protein
MIQLMAEAAGGQFLTLGLVPVTETVLGTNLGIVRTLHQTVLTGNTQAALGANLLTVGLHQGGIDQFQHFLAVVNQYNTAQNAHLRSSQTDTAGILQGLMHIVQQLVQLGIKVYDLFASLMQSRLFIR